MKKIISIVLMLCLVSLIAIPIIIANPEKITQEEHLAAESKQRYEYEHGIPFTPNAVNSQYIPIPDTNEKKSINSKTQEQISAEKEEYRKTLDPNSNYSSVAMTDEEKALMEANFAKSSREEEKLNEKEKDTYKILKKYYKIEVDLSSTPSPAYRDEVINLMVDAITTQNLTEAEHEKIYTYLDRRKEMYPSSNPMRDKIYNALSK